MEKVWRKIELCTEFDQDIKVSPTPEWDGIEIAFKEAGDQKYGPTLYLDKKTMVALIDTMRDVMEYTIKK